MTTAQRARSIRRRGSRRVGRKEPARSFGMRSSTSPALVDSRRLRTPLRWVVRSSVRSYRPAPIAWAASSSISSWRTSAIASRMTSMPSPARIASSSSDRADCERAIGVSFVILGRNTLRITPVAPDCPAQPASGAALNSHHSGGHSYVVVFDEAQRAWDAAKVAREHRGSTPGSEPEHLVKFAERIPEWSVIVGLIGSGPEINDGEEAGLEQWRWALEAAASPTEWTIVAPPESAGVFAGLSRVRSEPALRLDTELRYHAASVVHRFVDGLLTDVRIDDLRSMAHVLEQERYHLRITRDLDCARQYLLDRYADNPDARFGLIASSRDRDLPRFGVPNTWNATKSVRKGPWFCDGDEERFGRSCRSLRDCVTEFGCQGVGRG